MKSHRQSDPSSRAFITFAPSNAALVGSLLISILLLSGCERERPAVDTAPSAPTTSLNSPQVRAITEQLWQDQSATLTTVEKNTTALKLAIEQLIAQPTDEHLQTARNQWHSAHNALLQLTPLLALGHINPGLFQQIQQSQRLIDAQPLQPGYLDYFDVYRHSGLVNDIAVPLTAEELRQQHRFSDDHDISLGFHAIAYLLWGEEQQRPVADFIVPQSLTPAQRGNGLKLVDLPSHRRGTLLQLQATLLLDDLGILKYKLSQRASALNIAYHSLSPGSRVQLWQQAYNFTLAQAQRQIAQLPEPGDDEYSDHNRFSGERHVALAAMIKGVAQQLYATRETEQHLALLLYGEAVSKTLGDTLEQLHQALLSENEVPLNERDDIADLLQQSLELLADSP